MHTTRGIWHLSHVSEHLYTLAALTAEVSLWCSANRRLGVSQKENRSRSLREGTIPRCCQKPNHDLSVVHPVVE